MGANGFKARSLGRKIDFQEVRAFGRNPGALQMLSYVPRNLPQSAPLVVVLHGCTQRAAAHAHSAGWVTLADRLGFALLAPEQDRANNPNRCFNWFEPGDITRGSGEAASIHAMIQYMLRTHHLDAGRVFVSGLSAGGAMAAVVLATYPETFAAGAVIAGLPFGVACNVQQALAAMGKGSRLSAEELAALVGRAAPRPRRLPKLTIWHGQADGTVASSNAQALARQWVRLHGLSEQPSETSAHGRWSRSVWLDSSGAPAVELNLVAGLGHGTPLAARGDDPIGGEAPFMLEAGVSSTLEVARFWGLAPAAALHGPSLNPEDTRAQRNAEPPAGASEQPRDGPQKLGEGVVASLAGYVPDEVKTVIVKALTSAGLLR